MKEWNHYKDSIVLFIGMVLLFLYAYQQKIHMWSHLRQLILLEYETNQSAIVASLSNQRKKFITINL